jgi:SSS family solute:Na+ symporter
MADFFEERYGSKLMAGTFAIIGGIGMMTIIGFGFTARSKTIQAITPKTVQELTVEEQVEYQKAQELEKLTANDFNLLTDAEKVRLNELRIENPGKLFSHISESLLLWIVCGIVIIYAVAGGLEAAFLTDVLQGIFIILLSFLLLPFAWKKINVIYGGETVFDALKTIHQRLPESFFDVFGSPSAIDFTWYFVIAVSVISAINVVVQPNMLVSTGSARDEYAARFGFLTGTFIKRICTVFWGVLGIACILLYGNTIHNPDLVWGYATLDLLGPLKLGLVELMIACLMAALMSSADCLMITGSSLLIKNVYRPLFPNHSEIHYVQIGRIVGAIVVIGGAFVAMQFDSVFALMKFSWEFYVMVAASFWLGMKWRGANRQAAWISILISLLLFSLGPILTPTLFSGLRTQPYLLKMTHPAPLQRIFTAHEMDVEQRINEIARWDDLNKKAQAPGERPDSIKIGEKFTRTDILPQRAIFWTQGIKINQAGQKYGSGALNIEMILINHLGFDLSLNPHALNETIRIIIKTFLPFLILLFAAFFTRPDDRKQLDQFFVKMKTPVHPNPAIDAKELELSFQNPERFNHIKLFPNSRWEFNKWNKTDIVGFFVSILIVAAIIGFLVLFVAIGG